MGAALMKPYRDEAGNLRPDLDYREVPSSVMAEYLGVHRDTFHSRWVAGVYPRSGGRSIGRVTYFRPRIIMGIDVAPTAIRA